MKTRDVGIHGYEYMLKGAGMEIVFKIMHSTDAT
jgi:hypothetical protein